MESLETMARTQLEDLNTGIPSVLNMTSLDNSSLYRLMSSQNALVALHNLTTHKIVHTST